MTEDGKPGLTVESHRTLIVYLVSGGIYHYSLSTRIGPGSRQTTQRFGGLHGCASYAAPRLINRAVVNCSWGAQSPVHWFLPDSHSHPEEQLTLKLSAHSVVPRPLHRPGLRGSSPNGGRMGERRLLSSHWLEKRCMATESILSQTPVLLSTAYSKTSPL